MAQHRLLFVDDDPSVRMTLPVILENQGFRVDVASSVPTALEKMSASTFDVLLSDLNIHREGDGFLVIGAMRHLQPKCINLILTAYPGLDNALLAIQQQVDDYFIKPTDTALLISRIKEKLGARTSGRAPVLRRLSGVLRENNVRIMQGILSAMKRDPRTAAIRLSDEARIDHWPLIFRALIEQLESETDHLSAETMRFAVEHGKRRKKEGYGVRAATRDFQLITEVVLDLIHSEVMPMGAVGLSADIRRLTKSLDALMLKSLEAYEQPN
jgi:DNA-binding response OmpR family regulator